MHFFDYANGGLAVTENHEPVWVIESRRWARAIRRRLAPLALHALDPYAIRRSSAARVSTKLLRINHYVVKSRAEFDAKRARWDGEATRVDRSYFRYHDRNEIHDPILVEHAPKLKRRLAEITRPTS